MQECGKSFTLLINHWVYCCTYFPELLFFQAIWFISVTLQLFHKKKVPETSGFLLLCLCVGAAHIYTCVQGDWLQCPYCSSLSHLIFPSLDKHRLQKRQLRDQKVEILAVYYQHHPCREKKEFGSPHTSPVTIEQLNVEVDPCKVNLIPTFSPWWVICEREIQCSKQNTAEAWMQSTVYGFKRREEKFMLGSFFQIWKCAI